MQPVIPPLDLDSLVESLAQEANPLRRRQLLMAARDCWTTETVAAVLRRGGPAQQCGYTAGRAHGPLRRVAFRRNWATTARAPPDSAPWGTSWSASAGTCRRWRHFEQALEIYERMGDEMEVGAHAQLLAPLRHLPRQI